MLGVYDHPADPDVPGLKSISVGDGFLASWAQKLTAGANFAADVLDKLDPLP